MTQTNVHRQRAHWKGSGQKPVAAIPTYIAAAFDTHGGETGVLLLLQ
jgi:hypothetical protein